MKKLITLSALVCATTWSAFSQSPNAPAIKGYNVETTVSGDLNKDGINDLVVVYQHKPVTYDDYENLERLLVIYKKSNGSWVKWSESKTALLGTQEGGSKGDPLTGVEIKNGILIIDHYGGSSWSWAVTDKYRFQNNDFYLIGYTSESGQNGNEWTSVDYNLSTGQINYTHTTNMDTPKEKVQKETFYHKGLKITLKNRNKNVTIVSPKYKAEINL